MKYKFDLFWMFVLLQHVMKHYIQTRSDPDVLSRPLCFRITGSKNVPTRSLYFRITQSYMGSLYNYTSFRDGWLSSLQMNLMRVLLIDGYRMQPGMIHTPTHWCLLVWNANLSASIPVPSGPGPHRLQEIVMEFGCLELVPTKEPPKPLRHQPL